MSGVPVLNDNDPFWGSQLDTTPKQNKMPVNPGDLKPDGSEYGTAINLTFASLPLTLRGDQAGAISKADGNAQTDLADVQNDVPFIAARNRAAVPFGWYEEGYDREPVDDMTVLSMRRASRFLRHPSQWPAVFRICR